MYICMCNGITDKQLDGEINKNVNASVKDICKRLGIGTDCGTCIQNVVQIRIDKARLSKNKPNIQSNSVKV
jgi:bacterioferritin-associated ferredoxin